MRQEESLASKQRTRIYSFLFELSRAKSSVHEVMGYRTFRTFSLECCYARPGFHPAQASAALESDALIVQTFSEAIYTVPRSPYEREPRQEAMRPPTI